MFYSSYMLFYFFNFNYGRLPIIVNKYNNSVSMLCWCFVRDGGNNIRKCILSLLQCEQAYCTQSHSHRQKILAVAGEVLFNSDKSITILRVGAVKLRKSGFVRIENRRHCMRVWANLTCCLFRSRLVSVL